MTMGSPSDSVPTLSVRFASKDAAARLGEAVARALAEFGRVQRDLAKHEIHVWEDEERRQDDDEMPLFIEDTAPMAPEHGQPVIPVYSRRFDLLTADAEKRDDEGEKPPKRICIVECFNCDEPHSIKDCPYPRNGDRINKKRMAMRTKNVRYHADEGQDEGMPGKLSKRLRKALGLNKYQLPLHIYRMRMLGYPPGWLQSAKVAHSGIAMFDSEGNPVAGEDEKEFQMTGCRDEYNVNKIYDFPGFNVPPSSRCVDESSTLGLPPFSEDHSKMLMLEKLAPSTARAYRRRRMKAAQQPECQPGDVPIQTDMDLEDDDDDEDTDTYPNGNGYYMMPPLPPGPPMMPQPPAPPPPPAESPPPPPPGIESIADIPIPTALNEVDDNSARSGSPSLTELECQKLSIMAELEAKESLMENGAEESQQSTSEPEAKDCQLEGDESQSQESSEALEKCTPEPAAALDIDSNSESNINADSIAPSEPIDSIADTIVDTDSTSLNETFGNAESNTLNKSASNGSITSTPKQGRIRESSLGTPTLNLSKYTILPSSESFSKGICDELMFENLPDSTGKYKQMSSLIKKVRVEITKIQEDL